MIHCVRERALRTFPNLNAVLLGVKGEVNKRNNQQAQQAPYPSSLPPRQPFQAFQEVVGKGNWSEGLSPPIRFFTRLGYEDDFRISPFLPAR